jgi:hypothetical protein
VPDEILSEHEKKDWKMRPGKMEMRWIGVVDDDGNVIGRYISISNTSTGGFPRVPATQIWQHDSNEHRPLAGSSQTFCQKSGANVARTKGCAG